MRSAEGGKEVVERVLFVTLTAGKPETPLVPVAVEEVVFADGGIEEASRRNARWVCGRRSRCPVRGC